jgi:hypothetical protein
MRANKKSSTNNEELRTNNSSPQTRTIKIHPRQRYKRKRDVPEIRLYGNWLADLGFHQGNKIRVTMMEHMLIITCEVQ